MILTRRVAFLAALALALATLPTIPARADPVGDALQQAESTLQGTTDTAVGAADDGLALGGQLAGGALRDVGAVSDTVRIESRAIDDKANELVGVATDAANGAVATLVGVTDDGLVVVQGLTSDELARALQATSALSGLTMRVADGQGGLATAILGPLPGAVAQSLGVVPDPAPLVAFYVVVDVGVLEASLGEVPVLTHSILVGNLPDAVQAAQDFAAALAAGAPELVTIGGGYASGVADAALADANGTATDAAATTTAALLLLVPPL